MASQKNIVGNIAHVQHARIGDELHIHLAEPVFAKELTLNIPRTHPGDIIGREEDLRLLRASLQADKRVVVVNGLGGIGKTTLARVYVSQYYEAYNHILWITQESNDIANDFINTAGLLRNLGLESSGMGSQLLFEEVIRKLKTISQQPNLLVIDNGEQSIKKYRDMLPSQPHWHLLVTSREALTGFHRQTLDFFNEEQAIALFKKHYQLPIINDTGIKKLVKEVGYHTLTIEIMARMAAVQRYDLPTLRKAIANNLKANIEVAHNRQPHTISKVGAYLSATFTISQLNDNEVWLLKQFVCLPPEPHTYQLLRNLLVDEQEARATWFAETLAQLANKGWLLYNTTTDSYSAHRIIIDVVRKECAILVEAITWLITRITSNLHEDFTLDNVLDKFEWVPFGKAILAVFPKSTAPVIAQLQNRLGFVLLRLNDLPYARSILEKAIRSDEKNYGIGHPLVTMHYNNLALVLRDQGELAAAKALLEKAARYDKKNLGPMHYLTAMRYHNLGLVLLNKGNYIRARLLIEKSMRISEKNFGPNHPSSAISYSSLADVYKEEGNLRAAMVWQKKAIKGLEQYYGIGHPSIMIYYNNLAILLNDQGKSKEAVPLYKKAILISEKIFGANHPETAFFYRNLALAYDKMKNYAAAKTLLEKTLHIHEEQRGAWHADTAITLQNLAMVVANMKDYTRAEALYKKAIKIWEKKCGPNHVDTIDAYSDLAELYSSMDAEKQAKPILKKVIGAYEKRYGKNHLITALAYYSQALTCINLDEFNQGEMLLQKALPVLKKNLSKNDSRLKWALKLDKLFKSA